MSILEEIQKSVNRVQQTMKERRSPLVTGLMAVYLENLVWIKFPGELYGADLKIAFQQEFAKDIMPEANSPVVQPDNMPKKMDHFSQQAQRYYSPGFIKKQTETRQEIIFIPRFTSLGEHHKALIFRRKKRDEYKPEYGLPMAMARFGEDKAFGFSLWRPGEKGSPGYVDLHFPGITGKFEPVYVSIYDPPTQHFLKVEAEEIAEGILVRTYPVEEDEVPPHLLKAW